MHLLRALFIFQFTPLASHHLKGLDDKTQNAQEEDDAKVLAIT
jgi:hypothetical protein